MARKNADDLLAELDELGGPESSNSGQTGSTNNAAGEGDDVLADLQAQLAAKSQSSRPTTPRMSSSTTSGTNKVDHTPASSGPPSGRTSEDRLHNAPSGTAARSSGEGRSYHRGVTPDVANEKQEPSAQTGNGESSSFNANANAGGGWWGSMFSAASAAVKQAETLAKEIRGNEEAQRWADQVRSNIGNLQNLGTDLRSRALPTFTSLISHIAPPISAHEHLQIHITHDIANYPSLDPLIYSTFSRVMAQVEGGDLMVIQRGSENRSRAQNESDTQGYRGGVLGSGSGWTDGPWWREEHVKRDLGSVPGLKEGTRLARVSAEAYAKEFFDSRGGLEEVAQKATETLSEINPVRSSDIFLAIQAISRPSEQELFAESSSDAQPPAATGGVAESDESPGDLITFAIYLHDPIHSLSFSALSQSFPQKWATWLDASASSGEALPESITEIIAAGGVDPREWVAEWMEEVLSLGVGVVAQQYVAKRMGVGEGGIGRGKRRVEEDNVAGEAARAV
nr:maintenance of telomere capping protein 1 [Quercus suber]